MLAWILPCTGADGSTEVCLALLRLAAGALGALGLWAVARRQSPRLLLGLVLLGNLLVWSVTTLPLQRIYAAVGPNADRVGNLGLCQVVAAGNSPLRTAQAGQLHFEPFWSLFVAIVSGFDTDRVLALYPFLPLLMALGFALTLPLALGPSASPWERALVAGFGTLLASAPLDFTGPYRTPWAMTFLLKPNHALGLVLLPLVLRAFASIRGWRDRLLVGLLLQLLGWVFVVHMAYFCVGLVLYALLARWGPEPRRDVLDVAAVIGVNVLVVSPYLVMLLMGYSVFSTSARLMIPPWSPHLLETTTRAGLLLPLALLGLRVLWRRGDRASRALFCQVVGGQLVWLLYVGLSVVQLAKEKDEAFFWARFLLAAAAGVGAWDLAARLAPALGRDLLPGTRAAAIGLLALPLALPVFWDPARMDPYFPVCREPLPELVTAPTEFLRHHTDPAAVVAGDREYLRWVAAYGARRILLGASFHAPRNYVERDHAEELLVRSDDSAAVLAAAHAHGLRYLVVTPALLLAKQVSLAELEARPHLRRVHLTGTPPAAFVAIYEIVG
jgi:hypothetical protein